MPHANERSRFTVLKLGGELLENSEAMASAAHGISTLAVEGPLVVVHGGGRAIDADLRARGVVPRFVDGVRITDATALDSVVAVLAGRINTAFVAALGAEGVAAVGLTAADATVARCTRAPMIAATTGTPVDAGLVGVPCGGDPPRLLLDLLALHYVPVVATIGSTPDGALVNVNADVLAAHLARVIRADRLIIAGSTPGVLDAAGRTCTFLDPAAAREMVASGTARDGMVAKINAAISAADAGVRSVCIVDGRDARYGTGEGTMIAAAQEVAGRTC